MLGCGLGKWAQIFLFLAFSCDAAGLRHNPLSDLQLHGGLSVCGVQHFGPRAVLCYGAGLQQNPLFGLQLQL